MNIEELTDGDLMLILAFICLCILIYRPSSSPQCEKPVAQTQFHSMRINGATYIYPITVTACEK